MTHADSARSFEATAMPDHDWWAALWPDPRAVLEASGLGPGQRCVDLCSGDGYFTIPMAALTHASVIGIELDPELLALAEAAARAAGVGPELQFIVGDVMRADVLVPAAAQPVDVVVIANTFHGAPDKPALARVARALVETGGRFVVINWWPRPRAETPVLGQPRGPRDALRFAPEQVAAWVEPAGFTLAEIVDVGPYHYAASFVAD
jgi:SAM-dependent methyltransferase